MNASKDRQQSNVHTQRSSRPVLAQLVQGWSLSRKPRRASEPSIMPMTTNRSCSNPPASLEPMSVSASDATAARWIGNPFGSYNLRRPSYQDQPIYANHNAAVQDITSQHHFISTSVQTNHTDRVYDRSLAHTLHVKSVATSPTTSNTTLHAEQTDSSFQQHSLAHASSKSDSTSKHQPSDPSTFVPSLSRHSIASLYSLINPDSLDQQLYRLPRPHIYGVANASLAEDTCDSSIYTDNTMSDCDEDDVSVLDQWVFPNPAILDESELSQKHKQY